MSEATIYLVKAICDLLTIAIILNFFFRLFRVDYYNPLVRGIVSIVDPPIRLVRVFLKPFYNLDLSSILVSVIIQSLSFYLIALTGAITSSPVSLILWSFYSILLISLKMLFWAMLVGIIISWVAPLSRHPAVSLMLQLSEPIFKPFRFILPPMGGLDFSPILAFIFLNFLQVLAKNIALEAGIPMGLSIGF